MIAKIKYLNHNQNLDFYHMIIANRPVDMPKEAVNKLDYIEVDLVDIDKDQLESVWDYMNGLYIPEGHPKRNLFHRTAHTSMCVGDIVCFEDGTTFMCNPMGFKEIN